MDYCPRGDLAGELVKTGQFPEEVARFYIAELLLAIEYLHKKNIIYRDLKPENMLIDVFGHMKLADFGLSKDGIGDEDRTKSFCGSPAYLSPEVLLAKNKNSKGYGKTADLYGIGAVLYEFIVGAPPYFSPEIPELFKKIKEGKLEFPKNVSPEARDLLKVISKISVFSKFIKKLLVLIFEEIIGERA